MRLAALRTRGGGGGGDGEGTQLRGRGGEGGGTSSAGSAATAHTTTAREGPTAAAPRKLERNLGDEEDLEDLLADDDEEDLLGDLQGPGEAEDLELNDAGALELEPAAGAAAEGAEDGAEPEEEEEELGRRPAKGRRAPKGPTPREREEHALTHLPYRSWCPACVAGRGRGPQHPTHPTKEKEPLGDCSTVCCDFWYPGAGAGDGGEGEEDEEEEAEGGSSA